MRGERPVKYQTRFDFANPECDPDRILIYGIANYSAQDMQATWKLLNTVWLDSEGNPIE